jgi:hypothetical protein
MTSILVTFKNAIFVIQVDAPCLDHVVEKNHSIRWKLGSTGVTPIDTRVVEVSRRFAEKQALFKCSGWHLSLILLI